MSEKYIQFVANYDDWVAIKKLKVEPGTPPRDVMQFLASLGTSLDAKVAQNLAKIVDLAQLDAAVNDIVGNKSEGAVAKIIADVSGGKVNKVINRITEIEGWQTKEKKELQEFCKVYALKRALRESGVYVDYAAIKLNIPGMKKRKK